MKKKLVKVLSLILVFSLLLSVFALSACTDKTRTLNDVEKSIVGKWRSMEVSSVICTFNDDGTWENTNGWSSEFKQENEITDEHGHYYIISFTDKHIRYAWFENDPDKMYYSDDFTLALTRITDDE